MQKQLYFLYLLPFICLLAACRSDQNNLQPTPEDFYLGGQTSIEGTFGAMFQQPAANLSATEIELHRAADRAFGDIFVTAPSVINGGLGTIYNQNSCEGCHSANGRANFPTSSSELGGLLLRISDQNGQAVQGFGGQLQTKSIFGYQPEGQVSITEIEHILQYANSSERVSMYQPIFRIVQTYIPLPASTLISARIAPPVIGLGLLEAIPPTAILEWADEFDTDNNGISGRANYVLDELTNQMVIGKFGWKASQPNLLQQTAHAYQQDMGITSWFLNYESAYGQLSQLDTFTDEPEIDSFTLKMATFYTQSLAVPTRRNVTDIAVITGKKLFQEIGCNLCHRTNFQTGIHPEYSFLSNQNIYPYTDLLLHDMGEGLADNRPDGLANGREWRTQPLWGIGLTRLVSGQTHFLHDGRAKSIEQAILWHGGEAQKVKDNFINLSPIERQSLIAFVESL